MATKPFIWLASYPKSGNTWVRIFLSCYLNDGPVDINSLPYALTHYDLKPYFYRSVAPRDLVLLSQYEVTNLRGAVLQHVYDQDSWPLILKTHHSRTRMFGVDLIPNRLSERGVYIVRDPRDVAVSWSNHCRRDLDATIDMMCDEGAGTSHIRETSLFHFLSTWSNHVSSWMSASEFEVACFRYEDFLTDGSEQYSKLLEFIGWEVDPDRIERALEFSSFGNLKSQEELVGFKELQNGQTFFKNGGSGNWRDVLTEDQIRRIERDHGEVMERLGYK